MVAIDISSEYVEDAVTNVGSGRILGRTQSVSKEVELQTEDLHEKHAEEGVNGRLLKDLMIIRGTG
jgi:hypothetical protein